MVFRSLVLLILVSLMGNLFATRIVGLVPARNEEAIIEQCLKSLSQFTDAIVFLDDASTDSTLEVVKRISQECKVETIIEKKRWYRDEAGDKNLLLQAGREIGGTHFIVLDADEVLTANCLDNDILRKVILKLDPGDILILTLIELWRSPDKFRLDKSVWSNQAGDFIFCDEKNAHYSKRFLHCSRSPNAMTRKKRNLLKMLPKEYLYKYQVFTEPNILAKNYPFGLMHFQFVNWENLKAKQAWYRCLEKIRNPRINVDRVNKKYAPSTNETNLQMWDVPTFWYDRYDAFDKKCYNKKNHTRKKDVRGWFKKYGKKFFADLDIWDVDWEE